MTAGILRFMPQCWETLDFFNETVARPNLAEPSTKESYRLPPCLRRLT